MTWDDCIYGLLLLISIGCALLSTRTGTSKKYFMGLTGLLVVFVVCGYAIWHSLLVTLVSISMICLFPKRSHIIVFINCFGYLVFFRTCHLFGFEKPPSHSNAVQLILTLKLVGAAFEIKDSIERDDKLRVLLSAASTDTGLTGDTGITDDTEQVRLQIKYLSVKADPIDLFVYSYCFVGLLTGPYFKYRVFLDCLSHQDTPLADLFPELAARLKKAALIGLAYLVTSHFYYIEYAKSDAFYARAMPYRLVFMSLMFLVFRFRMYFAWLVSECVCMCAGLGCYPADSAPLCGQGPTDLRVLDQCYQHEQASDVTLANFETIRNVNIGGCEWTPTVREGMRSWNTSVQFWLASYVHRRCPVRFLRTPMTMLVSAFWHGVHPGYYMSFMTIPLALKAELALQSLLGRPRMSSRTNDCSVDGGSGRQWSTQVMLHWPDVACWFFKMRVFDYCCMGFLLLEAGATWRYWCSIGLFMHVVMALLLFTEAVATLMHSADTRPRHAI